MTPPKATGTKGPPAKPRARNRTPAERLPLTKAQRDVVADYKAWRDGSGLNLEAAGARIQCSTATLSQIEHNTYGGDAAKYIKRMARVLAREKARARAWKRPPVQVTTVLRKLHSLFELCRDSGEMGFACTKLGIGKTIAAQEFAKANPDAILITAVKGLNDRALLRRLTDALNLNWIGTNIEQLDHVVLRLKQLGGPLIIVDECDYLGRTIHILRQMHDLAGSGIALLGTPAFMRLLRRRADGTEGQFFSRITHSLYLDAILEEDGERILAPFGLSSAAFSLAWQGSQANARRLVSIVMNAANLADAQGAPIDKTHIAHAVEAIKPLEL